MSTSTARLFFILELPGFACLVLGSVIAAAWQGTARRRDRKADATTGSRSPGSTLADFLARLQAALPEP